MAKVLAIDSSPRQKGSHALFDSLSASANLARSIVQMLRLTEEQHWPQMQHVIQKP